MEEMPFKLLLIVLLFGFTLSIGFKALEGAREAEEEVSAQRAISLLATKLQLVAMGAPGAKESAEFELIGNSKITLSNEELGDEVMGKVEANVGRRMKEIEIIPLPFGDGKGIEAFSTTYSQGKHRITFVHEVGEGGEHHIAVG